MYEIALGCLIILAISAISVACWSLLFARVFRRYRKVEIADDELPVAAVLMGMKGTDPFLLDGLKRVMQQNYPRYLVRLVIDSRTDPAWEIAEQAIQETGFQDVTIEEFRDIPEHGIVNCTNSKVVQALRALGDGECEVVAMADGDVVANENWLRELVAPLVRDPEIGATSGNRWFIPQDLAMGALVRRLWGAAASSIMYLLNMPWGGCFAIRVTTVRKGDLIEKWSKVAALDMWSTKEIRKQKQKVSFVPSLMMINTESCRLLPAANFIRRQLTWARLYNPRWPFVVVHTGLLAVVYMTTLTLIPLALIRGDTQSAVVATTGVVCYPLVMVWLIWYLEQQIRHCFRLSGKLLPVAGRGLHLKSLFAVPVSIVVQLVAMTQAIFVRKVPWRGLIMDIRGPHDIRIVAAGTSKPPQKNAT